MKHGKKRGFFGGLLLAAVQVRAEECVGSFSHTRPDGSSYRTALSEQGVE